MSRGFASNYRIVLLATGIFACFGALGARLVWLHVINREELLSSITKAREQLIVEKARRGDILDRTGNILATSRSLVKVSVDPWYLRIGDEKKWPRLATLLGMPLADVEKIFTTKFRPAVPATPAPAASSTTPAAGLVFNFRPLNESTTEAKAPAADSANAVATGDAPADDDDTEIEVAGNGMRRIRDARLSDDVPETLYEEIQKLDIRGLKGERIYRRTYPHGQLAAHVIGYVNKAQSPATGIERTSDFYLRGQDGWRESEKDGRRRELAQFRSREVPRADGYNVRLSLDQNVQFIIERELAEIAQKFQPEKAMIIVSDPRDGFILGIGNYPTFDLNEYGKVPKEEQARMRNMAVMDYVEPGSTFKMVSVSAGLEEGVIVPSDRFNCALDKVEYKGRVLKLPGEAHHFDHPLTISEIVAHSSNKGAAQVGMRLGDQRLYNYARAFGFGRQLGYPGAEGAGMLVNPDVKTDSKGNEISKWNPLDITRIPMGHTVSATPLQMHMAMSTVATGGVLLRPQVVREIKDASGEKVCGFERTEINRAISEKTAQLMARMLMGVATKEGTAPQAAIPGFEVAGKTGTTQMIVDGKYSEKHHVASFVGFFPASNPQVAITVIVQDADAHCPGGIAAGASVAAPSFKKIGEQLIPYLGITVPKPVQSAQSVPALLADNAHRR